MKLHKVYVKFVPKILSEDQRKFRVECCIDILAVIEADLRFINVHYECKRHSAQWKHATSSRHKKAKMSRLQETMAIPFPSTLWANSRRMGSSESNRQ